MKDYSLQGSELQTGSPVAEIRRDHTLCYETAVSDKRVEPAAPDLQLSRRPLWQRVTYGWVPSSPKLHLVTEG